MLNHMLNSPVSFLPQCYVVTIIILILQMSSTNPVCIVVKNTDSSEEFGSSTVNFFVISMQID